MGFTDAELQACRGALVDDLVGDDCRLLFVGINPSLWSAATGAHFARRGNRFYPALHRAGILDRVIDASRGWTDADRADLMAAGVGITNIVGRATARADELDVEELRAGWRLLADRVDAIAPTVVAIAGITAYRSASGDRAAGTGRQSVDLRNRPLWVVPNPSGLNAHHTVNSLAAAYREVAIAAGLTIADPVSGPVHR
ncbi:mismatch-specific DNA-glycosylase [Williamsia sp. CHRR-6]|uniref:mismatch-specific DNA-glycosylase n=1 Tax=Williamsia sp. CHRR-6 TaxID=2835871 RepID=UPI001BDA3CB6|nr:mismatch-specific DNA-glycosylase [Williamsia sp. CHRR-6]MBT0568225.1 mismatch-specific DNA-glycosylase [Williamsia sp. CHRR-6]